MIQFQPALPYGAPMTTAPRPVQPAASQAVQQQPLSAMPQAPLQAGHFAGRMIPAHRAANAQRILYGNNLKQKNIPVVNLQEFNNPATRAAFVQKLGKGLQEFGFVAVDGHGVSQKLIDQYYRTLNDVFVDKMTMEQKLKYVRPELGRARGYYELGREKKAAQVGGEKNRADLKENWHSGRAANVFPTEVPIFSKVNPQLFRAMEKTGIQLVEAIGLYLDSIGLNDNGYLKSIMVNDKGRGNGSHLLRSIHYPPVEQAQAQQYKPGEPIIRAGEHYDLNLITLLPQSTEAGLEILRRKEGQEDSWMPIFAQDGTLILNVGDMLSLITGGKTNERGTIDVQGRLPSTRHRVVAYPHTVSERRFSIPFFMTPHYDKPLRNLVTGEELATGEFSYRRLQGHGSLPTEIGYKAFRRNMAPIVGKA